MGIENVVNFNGNAIVKRLGFFLTDNEKSFLKEYDLTNINKESKCLISKNKNILEDKNLKRIKLYFDKVSKEYLLNAVGINHDLQLNNSWITINTKNSFHDIHHHPNTFISICFYPQLESGDIIFNEGLSIIENRFNFNYNKTKKTFMNSSEYILNLAQNDTVIFPGWLRHGSTPNTSTIPRIMIGVNYFLKGKLGSKHSVDELTL